MRNHGLRGASAGGPRSSSTGCGAWSTGATTRPGSPCATAPCWWCARPKGKLARLAEMLDADPGGRHAPASATPAGPPTACPATTTPTPTPTPAARSPWSTTGSSRTSSPSRRSWRPRERRFASETDSEVLAHLIAQEYDGDLLEATRRAVAPGQGGLRPGGHQQPGAGAHRGGAHDQPVGGGPRRGRGLPGQRHPGHPPPHPGHHGGGQRGDRRRHRRRGPPADPRRPPGAARPAGRSPGTPVRRSGAATRTSCSRRSTSSPRRSPRP